jgi:hypothetical protein
VSEISIHAVSELATEGEIWTVLYEACWDDASMPLALAPATYSQPQTTHNPCKVMTECKGQDTTSCCT